MRKRLLEVFLQKIVSVPFLYGGEEFQLFIRSETDFKALIEKKKAASIRSTATTYITTFPEYDVLEVQPRVEAALCTNRTAISAITSTMVNVADTICRTCTAAVLFEQTQARLGECLEGFQSQYFGETEKRKSQTFRMWKEKGEVEGMRRLSDWAQVEVMDLRALLEAFQSLEAVKVQTLIDSARVEWMTCKECKDNKIDVVLKCGHGYCKMCIRGWYEIYRIQGKRNWKCPICKEPMHQDSPFQSLCHLL